jgi:Na+-transporting methylmalonyl-CoA/oxaloacetate decarboxylase gamma subunit
VAPGVVLLIGGLAVLVAGVGLVVVVLRMLLAQAVARDTEAHHLRAELDEVI